MKWLKSTSQKAWTVNGKIIPACVTPTNDYLKLNDTEYTKLKNIPVIASLIKAGGILVLDQEPAELKNSLEGLKGSNAALVAEKTLLQEQLKAKDVELAVSQQSVETAKKETKEIKEQAIKELQEKQDEIDDLKKQIATLKKKAK